MTEQNPTTETPEQATPTKKKKKVPSKKSAGKKAPAKKAATKKTATKKAASAPEKKAPTKSAKPSRMQQVVKALHKSKKPMTLADLKAKLEVKDIGFGVLNNEYINKERPEGQVQVIYTLTPAGAKLAESL